MTGAAPAPRSQPERAWLRDLVPLRPQGSIEIVDRATQILRTRARDLVVISLGVNVPMWLILAAVLRDEWARGLVDNPQWFWSSLLPEPFLFSTAGTGLHGSTLTLVLGRALPSIGLATTGAAAGFMVGAWSKGLPMTGTEALVAVARRSHKLMAVWALVHVIEIATCVGVVIGPIIFGITAPLWAIESLSVRGAITRSWQLCRRQLHRSTGTVTVATGISLLVGGLLGGAPLIFLYAIAGQWIDLGGTATVALAGVLPHAVIDPLLAMAMALLAIDLKVRVEGADLLDGLEALHRAST